MQVVIVLMISTEPLFLDVEPGCLCAVWWQIYGCKAQSNKGPLNADDLMIRPKLSQTNEYPESNQAQKQTCRDNQQTIISLKLDVLFAKKNSFPERIEI